MFWHCTFLHNFWPNYLHSFNNTLNRGILGLSIEIFNLKLSFLKHFFLKFHFQNQKIIWQILSSCTELTQLCAMPQTCSSQIHLGFQEMSKQTRGQNRNMWGKMKIKVTFRFRKRGRLSPLKTFGLRMDYWPKDSCIQLTLSAMGVGGSNWPTLFLSIYHGQTGRQKWLIFFTFPIFPLTKDLTQKKLNFFRGVPPFCPSKRGGPPRNDPPSLPMPPFF